MWPSLSSLLSLLFGIFGVVDALEAFEAGLPMYPMIPMLPMETSSTDLTVNLRERWEQNAMNVAFVCASKISNVSTVPMLNKEAS